MLVLLHTDFMASGVTRLTNGNITECDTQPPVLNHFTLDLVSAFDLQLKKCFGFDQEYSFSVVSNNYTESDVSTYHTLKSWLRDPLNQTDDVDWWNSSLFKAYKNSLNLTPGNVENIDLDLSEDEEIVSAFDHHALITSQLPETFDEPIQTADEVIKEIDLIMGHDDASFSLPLNNDHNGHDTLVHDDSSFSLSFQPLSEQELQGLDLNQLNSLLEELESCVREHSAVLVQELADREELDFEQEQKDIFIARLDEVQRRLERRRRRASMPPVGDHAHVGVDPDMLSNELFIYQDSSTDQVNLSDPTSSLPLKISEEPTVNKAPLPAYSRAQSAALAAVAAASSATSAIRRQWNRLSRGPDEMAAWDQQNASKDLTNHGCDPTAESSRARTIARLRKWAGKTASQALGSSNTSTGAYSFSALLGRGRTRNGDKDDGTKNDQTQRVHRNPCLRSARSEVTTPTLSHSELCDIPPVLTHSASGHLICNREYSAEELEYKALTTSIPYHRSLDSEGPRVEQLRLFNDMLLAILTSNPNLTPMLTDYILNVYAPSEQRLTCKLPF